MTIPIDVRGILGSWDVLTADHDPDGWPAVRMRELTTICAHLLSQDAEIERLNAECKQHLRQAMENGRAANEAESRLAAANALLCEALSWTLKYP